MNANPVQPISEYEGRQEHINDLALPPLEVVDNKLKGVEYRVQLDTKELNSICPRTGLPDFGRMELSYIPNQVVVEEKALKLHLTAYRNVGIFKEFMAAKFFKDFVEATKPKWAKVHYEFEPRGGLPSIVDIAYDGAKIYAPREVSA